MGIKAFITGLAGTEVTQAEQNFLYQEHPWGLILFARNIEDRKQVRKLVDQFRDAVGRADAPVLIDQEGGRVQRLKPPVWPKYASGEVLANLWRKNRKAGERAIYLQSRLMAHDLAEVGINVDCLPVLDVPVKDGHDVIGDRAYSTDPNEVAKMGRFACQGLLSGGVLPVIKHIPGHGRAMADSHLELPIVDASLKELRETDFVPFKALNDMPMAMTAHVRYQNLDETNCATVSKTIIDNIIRGEIGFNGLLMSDDLSMQALEGDFAERSEACFEAGCDMLLHCNGQMAEMEEIAAICHVLEGDALERAQSALEQISEPDEIDVDALHQELSSLLEASA
ncbi:MAG: beta-N-acetylhexosaminidase [Nitratireductor sp.]